MWVASAEALWRMDPATGRFTGSLPLAHTPSSLALGDEALWVSAFDGNLLRIDPTSRTDVKTMRLGVRPLNGDAIAVGEGAVWVALTSLVGITP